MKTDKLKKVTIHPIDNGWVVQTVEGEFFPRTRYFATEVQALAEVCSMVAAQAPKEKKGSLLEFAARLEKIDG